MRIEATKSSILALADLLAAPPRAHGQHTNKFVHLLFSFGVAGLFFVSIIDSSFVPLPIPGMTDILIILFAAQKTNWILLVVLATAGSAVGGYLSYQVGQRGGMTFLEKHVPARIFKRVCSWMENNAILAVALPALLPPPMPLSPFVLAAGALKMTKSKFMTTFTISRAVRHSIAAFLGIHYGRHVLRLWNAFSAKWATTFLIVVWTIIVVSAVIAFWKLFKTSRSVGVGTQEMLPRSRASL
jgi:membrane protein YqaA with SNARE-associated domain